MRMSAWVFSLIVIGSNAIAAPSVKRATPAEAKDMLRKATAYYDRYGRKKALVEFNRSRSSFRDRDLYVFCVGPDNRFVANGQFPGFVGHLADTIKDVDGKSVVEAGRKIATTSGNAELHYIWPNPETGLLESKISYFAQAGQDVCGVGAYNPK